MPFNGFERKEVSLETILAAVLTSAASVAATLITVSIQNSKTTVVMQAEIKNLTEEVEKHNGVIERTFRLEEQNKTLFRQSEENAAKIAENGELVAHASERAEAAHRRLDRSGVDSH